MQNQNRQSKTFQCFYWLTVQYTFVLAWIEKMTVIVKTSRTNKLGEVVYEIIKCVLCVIETVVLIVLFKVHWME